MPVWHAIVLGAVQGLTEFLPISSSGHLILVPWLMGWNELENNPELERAFDVALHIGTFAGAAAYFREDLVRLGAAVLRTSPRDVADDPDARMAWLLALSAVPAAVAGATLDAAIDGEIAPEWMIGVLLVVFGLVLLAADRLASGGRQERHFRPRDALLMGAAQACALVPGVSRSGATISMSRFLGFARNDAARLSFLMSLPVIGGAGVYELVRVMREGGMPSGMAGPVAAGVLTSAVTGFLSVAVLLRWLRTRTFTPFVAYRVVAGAAVVAYALASGR